MSKSNLFIPKTVYHGTTSDNSDSLSQGINILHPGNKKSVDFAPGFYTTSNFEQAKAQANRQSNFRNKSNIKTNIQKTLYPVVFEYGIDLDKVQELNTLIFEHANIDWGRFVINNRTTNNNGENNLDRKHDMVFGPLADGSPFIGLVLDDYKNGIITLEDAIERISPKGKFSFPEYNQLSIHTEFASNCLEFKGKKEV